MQAKNLNERHVSNQSVTSRQAPFSWQEQALSNRSMNIHLMHEEALRVKLLRFELDRGEERNLLHLSFVIVLF
jgi:hypothetical protein